MINSLIDSPNHRIFCRKLLDSFFENVASEEEGEECADGGADPDGEGADEEGFPG